MKRPFDFLPVFTVILLGSVIALLFVNRPEALKMPDPLKKQAQRGIASVQQNLHDSLSHLTQNLFGGSTNRIYEFNDGKLNIQKLSYSADDEIIYIDITDQIRKAVPEGRKFKIIVANSKNSKTTLLTINDKSTLTPFYEERVRQYINSGNALALDDYIFDDNLKPVAKNDREPSATIAETSKNGLPISVKGSATQTVNKKTEVVTKDLNVTPVETIQFRITKKSLEDNRISQNSCSSVALNEPNKTNDYRNGALVLQVIDSEKMVLDSGTGTAARGSKLYWEFALFEAQKDTDCYKVSAN